MIEMSRAIRYAAMGAIGSSSDLGMERGQWLRVLSPHGWCCGRDQTRAVAEYSQEVPGVMEQDGYAGIDLGAA
jgi:hypothetical protein